MTMKAILVSVEDSDSVTSALECALLVAQQFGSYIEGLHIRPRVVGIIGADGMGAGMLVEDFDREVAERHQRCRRQFERFMSDKGVPWAQADQISDSPRAGWLDDTPRDDDFIGSRGRIFDLIVVPRPVRGASTATLATLESALFESGRPLLIAPPAAPAKLGEVVVIAWNGSTETARCVAASMPFLAQARKVVVLTIEEGLQPGPGGADMARMLNLNGIAAQPVSRKAGKRSVGEAILEEAAALDADLVVKGAYTQSRLRQMIFGGATSHLLAEAKLPIFMAH